MNVFDICVKWKCFRINSNSFYYELHTSFTHLHVFVCRHCTRMYTTTFSFFELHATRVTRIHRFFGSRRQEAKKEKAHTVNVWNLGFHADGFNLLQLLNHFSSMIFRPYISAMSFTLSFSVFFSSKQSNIQCAQAYHYLLRYAMKYVHKIRR